MRTDPKDVEYVVEATNFERLCLWERNDRMKRVRWEDDSLGELITITELKIKRQKYPVNVSVFYTKLNGHWVAFIEPVSLVVDHYEVEKWRKEYFPNAKGHSDAMNFHNCLHTLGI